LEKVANKGIYIKVILADDIDEIFHLRELLEAEAIREIMAAGSVPKRLHDLADAVSLHKPDTDTIANLKADIAFHKFLVESAGSPRLMNLYEGLLSEVKLCVFQAQAFVPARPENIVLHYKLLQAMEDGDLEKALIYLSEHMESAIESYQKGLLNRLNGKPKQIGADI
jgi:DNA-binding GntR family transcriptional regulator